MNQHHHLIDRLANVNGILTGIALYPQVILSIASGKTDGISSTAYGMIFLNSVIWALYAKHRSILPLIISSVLNTVASSVLVVLSFT